MEFALLCSGSKGNSFLVHDEDTYLLIDCGSTKKWLKSCFDTLGVKREDLDGVLITHDHSDHISQIRHFADLSIYAPVEIPDVDTFRVRPMQRFTVGRITVTPIALSHDAPNTTGYILDDGSEKIVYITDTGYVNEKYDPLLRDADYIVLESNHDVDLLMHTRRPMYLKQRICGDQGHLNNDETAEILTHIVTKRTKMILLAHISQEANRRELALQTTYDALTGSGIELDPALVIAAAGQFEMIRKGKTNEEMDPGSVSCTAGMEHRA